MKVSREQALAFRLRRHHLAERLAPKQAAAAALVGLQDTPPGAPLAVAERDLPIFTAGLEPPDEEAAKAVIGNAWKSLDGITAMDALDQVSEAVHESLRAGPLPRDDFHQALRERLPAELLWWCKGCGSHHVHPSLWRATGIRGVLAIVGREGRSAVFGLPPEVPALEDPGRELARRFLWAYGPARPKLLADWAGLASSHTQTLWARAGELTPVDLGGTKAWALADDADALADGGQPKGVRLLPNLDPLAAARDRELLVPDPERRRRIWRQLAGPGIVLVRGKPAALSRSAKKGRRLVVAVEPLAQLSSTTKDELAAEADRIAPFRGAENGQLDWA